MKDEEGRQLLPPHILTNLPNLTVNHVRIKLLKKQFMLKKQNNTYPGNSCKTHFKTSKRKTD